MRQEVVWGQEITLKPSEKTSCLGAHIRVCYSCLHRTCQHNVDWGPHTGISSVRVAGIFDTLHKEI